MRMADCSLPIRLLATRPSAAANAALSALWPMSPCSAFHDTSASPDSVSPKRELLTWSQARTAIGLLDGVQRRPLRFLELLQSLGTDVQVPTTSHPLHSRG